MRSKRTTWFLGALLFLAAPVVIGGPRAVCMAACADDGDDDACPVSCLQPCCDVLAVTLEAPIVQPLARELPERFPPPVSIAVPTSTDPAEILVIPKSALV